MAESFEITGGKKLQGAITPQGAKNEALQVMCATLLTSEPITIHNIPDIRDVNMLMDILKNLGVEIHKLSPGTYRFKAANIDLSYLKSQDFKQKGSALRGSVMILGALLADSAWRICQNPAEIKSVAAEWIPTSKASES